jgi:predicted nucleotidyltransferase
VEFDHEAFEGKAVYRLPGELSEVFGGRKIDLVEPEYLSPRLRDRVLAEAWDVFTA